MHHFRFFRPKLQWLSDRKNFKSKPKELNENIETLTICFSIPRAFLIGKQREQWRSMSSLYKIDAILSNPTESIPRIHPPLPSPLHHHVGTITNYIRCPNLVFIPILRDSDIGMTIGPLHLTVTRYGINFAGEQATRCDIQYKVPSQFSYVSVYLPPLSRMLVR